MVAALKTERSLFQGEGRRRLATGKEVLQPLDQVGHIVVGPEVLPGQELQHFDFA